MDSLPLKKSYLVDECELAHDTSTSSQISVSSVAPGRRSCLHYPLLVGLNAITDRPVYTFGPSPKFQQLVVCGEWSLAETLCGSVPN